MSRSSPRSPKDRAAQSRKTTDEPQQPSLESRVPWLRAFAPDSSGVSGPNLGGKWLVFVPETEVDSWWDIIKRAIEAGSLGDQAKVATAFPKPNPYRGQRVICVYTEDWRNKAEVGRVLTGLRAVGVKWRLSYKTDEATLSLRYGRGTAVYVSQEDSLDFEDRSIP